WRRSAAVARTLQLRTSASRLRGGSVPGVRPGSWAWQEHLGSLEVLVRPTRAMAVGFLLLGGRPPTRRILAGVPDTRRAPAWSQLVAKGYLSGGVLRSGVRRAVAVAAGHLGTGPARQVDQVAFLAATSAELVRPGVAQLVRVDGRDARLFAPALQ